MSDNQLPLSRPSLGEEEINEVIDVIRSGWITTGSCAKGFEEEFARYVSARHAVAVNSCTAALHLALLAHGIGPGDEVITSSMTGSATVNMIEVVGANPCLLISIRERCKSRRRRRRRQSLSELGRFFRSILQVNLAISTVLKRSQRDAI